MLKFWETAKLFYDVNVLFCIPHQQFTPVAPHFYQHLAFSPSLILFILSRVSLEEQKFLSVISLKVYAFCIVSKKFLLTPGSQRYSSRSFLSFHLAFMVHIDQVSSFCTWMARCSSSICSKDHPIPTEQPLCYLCGESIQHMCVGHLYAFSWFLYSERKWYCTAGFSPGKPFLTSLGRMSRIFLGQEDPLEKGRAAHSSILGLPWWLSW